MAKEHRGEGEGDRAEPIPQADYPRPRFTDGRAQETQEQQHKQNGGNTALDECQRLDCSQRVRSPGAGNAIRDREQPIDRHAYECRSRHLVRVVVTVVEGLVAGVLRELVDPRGVVLDQGAHQVVAAVLVPGWHLAEEAVAEEQRQRQDDLATNSRLEAGPAARSSRTNPQCCSLATVTVGRQWRDVVLNRFANHLDGHPRMSRTLESRAGRSLRPVPFIASHAAREL